MLHSWAVDFFFRSYWADYAFYSSSLLWQWNQHHFMFKDVLCTLLNINWSLFCMEVWGGYLILWIVVFIYIYTHILHHWIKLLSCHNKCNDIHIFIEEEKKAGGKRQSHILWHYWVVCATHDVQLSSNTLVQHMAMNMIMDIHMQNLRLFQKSGMYNGCHFRHNWDGITLKFTQGVGEAGTWCSCMAVVPRCENMKDTLRRLGAQIQVILVLSLYLWLVLLIMADRV